MVRAAGAAARLAAGIRLGAAGALGRAAWWRAGRRTAADAAARTFFIDQVCEVLAVSRGDNFATDRSSAAFGFPVAGACRCRGVSVPQAAPGIAGQLAGAAGALAAGADVDADVSAPVDVSGHVERRVIVGDPAV